MPEGAPEGPEGVWLEYADGTRVEDLPILYVGVDDEGCAMFEVLTPRDDAPVSAGARLWPGKTALILPKLVPRPEPQ